jgi:hypothetical protein
MKEEDLWGRGPLGGRGKERTEARTKKAAHIVLCHTVRNRISGTAGLSCVAFWTVILPSSSLKLES